MRFEILGPTRVVAGEAVLDVKAAKMQLLLTALLVRAGQTVTTPQLVTELWGDLPPRRALAALHVYISQLRKSLAALREAGAPGAGGDLSVASLVTGSSGYVFQLRDAGLDLLDLQNLMARGRACAKAGQHENASRLFRRAVGLWRGPWPGEGAEGPIISGFATWVSEARMECSELLMEAHLAAGRHREVIAPLRALIAQHPLRESFHRLLMLALYRSERQGDALMVYQNARRSLNQSLGVEPGRRLKQVQHQIICADRCLDLSDS
ncbi:AfsR/SARP family transcriptional regulator [Streptomyces sp. NPDC006976]|uniref:AfsR/SARP family transcriptional regulator n=1 Tax=Streptomyces sp. NPDC006976 TaxID=3154311 RepID=UPI0033C27E36